ncbi:ribosomal protection-like ABC-F family protein [Helicobacter himalayensis]|uniref:ribosomal protection-like ABC-F family protein n=1 Tax=Helicobacter himalayensis TaxID=1591088 RepID=UPI003D6FFDF9
MTLLSLLNASKQFEHKIILDSVSLSVQKGERIAVIGKNGSGKSTLLGLLDGNVSVDSGERVVSKVGGQCIRILSLEQRPNFNPTYNVAEVIAQGLDNLRQAHNRLLELQTMLETYEGQDSQGAQTIQDSQNPRTQFGQKALLEEYAQISSFLDEHNGWDLDSRVQEVLERFELQSFQERLAISLSGGEQKRVALCRLFLTDADLLILDEPTNHLDVEMVSFLERFIQESKFSLIFVSHDRYFIENIATRVIEVENAKISSFEGGYSSYLAHKEAQLHALDKVHQNLLKALRREEEWLRAGVKARLKRNVGRVARLESMRKAAKTNPSAIAKMRLELEREKKHFNRSEGKNTKKCLFELQNLNKTFYQKVLIKDLNLRILQNEKIAVVGKNGSGKSTFLRLLLGEIAPDSGVIKRGNIHIGYFDQHLASLDDSKDLLETFCPNGGDIISVRGKNMHVFGYLKNFLFPKEFLDKKIGFLSGGEKKRVALALLFAKEVDVLLLDEPTNDLDISTIGIVEEYLLNFSGAVIFVSHDRYFVDKLAHKLLIFEGEGAVVESYAPYSEYLDIMQNLREITAFERAQYPQTSQSQESLESKATKKQNKLSYKERLELDSLPESIEGLEAQVAKLKEDLSNPQIYEKKGILILANELEEAQNKLDSALERYFALEQKAQELRENGNS